MLPACKLECCSAEAGIFLLLIYNSFTLGGNKVVPFFFKYFFFLLSSFILFGIDIGKP